MKPHVLVLRAAGTNCEAETAHAFELVGAEVSVVHVNRLREAPQLLREARILALPGGFSYGDDIASGRVLANELMAVLGDAVHDLVDRGGYALGICNGFQVLVKSGLLPALDGQRQQRVTLTHNANGRYTDRWVRLEAASDRCAWLPTGIDEPLELPVAHAEGRFVTDPQTLDRLVSAGQVVLRYHPDDNFNGSQDRIAGICDPTGRIFGLMPHPERFLRHEHHPSWTRRPRRREGLGVRLFRAALRHAKEN